MNWQAYHQIKK